MIKSKNPFILIKNVMVTRPGVCFLLLAIIATWFFISTYQEGERIFFDYIVSKYNLK